MSFSWWIVDRDGADLLEEFGVNHQGLGLAPNCPDDTPATYRLSDIRATWEGVPFKEDFAPAAMAAVLAVREMLGRNVEGLKCRHCATCTCPPIQPRGWSDTDVQKFSAIPLDRVWRCGGGS